MRRLPGAKNLRGPKAQLVTGDGGSAAFSYQGCTGTCSVLSLLHMRRTGTMPGRCNLVIPDAGRCTGGRAVSVTVCSGQARRAVFVLGPRRSFVG